MTDDTKKKEGPYRKLFRHDITEMPLSADPLEYMKDTLILDHPMRKSVDELAEDRGWDVSQTLAFYLMLVDSAATKMSNEMKMVAEALGHTLSNLASASNEARRPVFVNLASAEEDDDVHCIVHQDQEVEPYAPCPQCIEAAIAGRPEGMPEEDAREAVNLSVQEILREHAGMDTAPKPQNAPSTETRQ